MTNFENKICNMPPTTWFLHELFRDILKQKMISIFNVSSAQVCTVVRDTIVVK